MKKYIAIALSIIIGVSVLSACRLSQGGAPASTASSAPPVASSAAAAAGGATAAMSQGSIVQAGKTATLETASAADTTFAVSSGKGVFDISMMAGSVPSGTILSVSSLTGGTNDITAAGFLVSESGKPGEHVTSSYPALITYLQKDPLPDDVCIIKYTDDGKSYTPVECQHIRLGDLYGLYTLVDSFSGYGCAAVPKDSAQKSLKTAQSTFKDEFIWQIEASGDYRLLNVMDAQSLDLDFYLKADSARSTFAVMHYGLFDINTFTVAKQSAQMGDTNVPIPIGMNFSDNKLAVKLIPMIRVVYEMPGVDGPLADLLDPEAPQERLIMDGFIGWSKANLSMGDFISAAGTSDKSALTVQIPLFIRIKEAVANVYFVYPGVGNIHLKGKYLGLGVKEASVPPALKDPKDDYSPSKPENAPPKWDDGQTPQNLLEGVSQQQDGTVTESIPSDKGPLTVQFGSFVLGSDGTDDKDAASINDVLALFDHYKNMPSKGSK